MDIDKIKKGDRDAWNELVEKYADSINRKVFNIINDKETAIYPVSARQTPKDFGVWRR